MDDGGGRSSMTQAEQVLKKELADARLLLVNIASELGMTAAEKQDVLSGEYQKLSTVVLKFIGKHRPECVCGWAVPGQQCPLHIQKTITVSRD